MSGSNSMAALPLAADILQLIHSVGGREGGRECSVDMLRELAHCTKYIRRYCELRCLYNMLSHKRVYTTCSVTANCRSADADLFVVCFHLLPSIR